MRDAVGRFLVAIALALGAALIPASGAPQLDGASSQSMVQFEPIVPAQADKNTAPQNQKSHFDDHDVADHSHETAAPAPDSVSLASKAPGEWRFQPSSSVRLAASVRLDRPPKSSVAI